MDLSREQIESLGIGLNEAILLGLEVDVERDMAGATFSVLTLPEQGESPQDTRVQFLFYRVGRVAASLRLGRWDDDRAKVVPFALGELLPVVQSFGGLAIYGWEFIDQHDQKIQRFANRLSLDYHNESGSLSHSIFLFQEGPDRFLEVLIWFDSFVIRDPQGQTVAADEFSAGGRRWWDALYRGDPRTRDRGIFPLK